MKLNVLVLLAAAPLAAQPAAPVPITAKVTETLMGPVNAGSLTARLYLSDDGNHIGIVGVKGSRAVVYLDGVEGPVFDEIPSNVLGNGTIGVFWSPTGGHSGYLGRRGGDLIAVVDGKEAGVVAPVVSQGGYYSSGIWKFYYNKDGSKMAYAVVPEAGAWIMIENGVKSPMYKAIDFNSVQLKGTRLVYAAQSLDSQWHIVVDGKPGPGYAEVKGLLLTPDGLHYAYIGTKNDGHGLFGMVAVNDGVESKLYQGVDNLEQAPDGRIAYECSFKQADVTRTSGPGGLWVGGVVYQGVQTFNIAKAGGYSQSGFNSPHVAWSPDGKRAAWVQHDAYTPGTQPKPGVQVMVNGKPMGPTYSGVNELQFSPDGSHVAYTANAPNGGWFANIDGQESDGFNIIYGLSFGSSGAHNLILGTVQGTGAPTAVLDGKPLGKFIGLNTIDIAAWSPDGSHVAWPVQANVNGYAAMKDGTALPGRLGNFMALNYVQPQITFPPLVWSPDGLHLAYAGVRPSDGHSVIFVDNTMYEGPGQSHTYPAFSPDSKHFATIMTTGRGWLAFIDGKSSQPYQDIVKISRSAAKFTGPSTYRFYGVKDGQIYRVTLDL